MNHTAAGIAYSFDEPNLISSAGLAPVLRLAQSAGLKNLADQLVTVANTGADKGANPGAKIMSLVAGMAAGADHIDDLDLLRHGGMQSLFEQVYAPSSANAAENIITGGAKEHEIADHDWLIYSGVATCVPRCSVMRTLVSTSASGNGSFVSLCAATLSHAIYKPALYTAMLGARRHHALRTGDRPDCIPWGRASLVS